VYLYERSPKCGSVRSPWAVKKINKRHANAVFGDRLEQEAKILKTLDHPNIIGYRAFKRDKDGVHSLVMEDGHTALYDLIDKRNEQDDGPFPASQIETVVRCAASALDYLHTKKCLMHGDIKSGNVLVVGDFETAKLCDFGVTLPVNEEGKVVDPKAEYVGTEAWSAMEVINQEEVITTKADIYSCGLLIYEMLALHGPHLDKLGLNDSNESDDDGADESLDEEAFRDALGTRPPLPGSVDLDETYRKVLEIFFLTTNEAPEKRPSAKEILDLLDQDSGDDSILCVNMVEGGAGDVSVNETSCDDGDDSVLCVGVVEAPPAL